MLLGAELGHQASMLPLTRQLQGLMSPGIYQDYPGEDTCSKSCHAAKTQPPLC